MEWTTVLSTADQSQGLVSHLMSDDKRNHLLLSWAQVQKRSHGKKSTKKISAYDVLSGFSVKSMFLMEMERARQSFGLAVRRILI